MPNPGRTDSLIVAFPQRFTAEKLVSGASDIPGVGKVQFSWVANSVPTGDAAATAKKTDVEEDTTMGGLAENGDGDGGKNGVGAGLGKEVHEAVDYDVAEDDDDRW